MLQSSKFVTFKDKTISSWIFKFFNLAFQFVMPEKSSGVPPWANNPGAPSWILVGKAGKTAASPTFYRKKSAAGVKRASLSKIYGSGPQNWRLRKISEKTEKSRYILFNSFCESLTNQDLRKCQFQIKSMSNLSSKLKKKSSSNLKKKLSSNLKKK